MNNEFYQKDSFWHSKISDYRTCPKLYELRHIEGIDLREDSLDTLFGTAIHLSINEILSKEGDGLELFDIFWDSIKNKKLKTSRFNWKQLGDMGPVFISRFNRLHAKNFKPLHMEERIKTKLGEHDFEGTPDFVGYYKGKLSIVDFKTSSKAYDKKKIICDEQMQGYAHLVKKELGLEIEQLVYFVFVKDFSAPRIQKPIILPLTNKTLISTVNNIETTCTEIAEKKAFIRNTQNCVRGPIICPAFHICHGGNE